MHPLAYPKRIRMERLLLGTSTRDDSFGVWHATNGIVATPVVTPRVRLTATRMEKLIAARQVRLIVILLFW